MFKNDYKLVITLVIVMWNVATFTMMKIDKIKAKKLKWRIKEKTIFMSAFLLGGFGVLAGMQIFRHKTKHWGFKIGIPGIVILNLILICYIYKVL